MKISALHLYNNKLRGAVAAQNSNFVNNPSCLTVSSILTSSPSVDSVSFQRRPSNVFINDLREIPDLNCACCGIKMMRNSKVNEFLNKNIYYPASVSLKRIKTEQYFNESHASCAMKKAYSYLKDYASKNPRLTMDDILSRRTVKDYRKSLPQEVSESFDKIREMTRLIAHNSKYMTDEISKINPDFHKTEKKVFKELKRLSQEYPNETFWDILNKPEINQSYLKNLQTKQLTVLDHLDSAMQDVDSKQRTYILNEIENAIKVFTQEKTDVLHKRGRVISAFKNLHSTKKVSDTTNEKIMEILSLLPDSKTDVDAFMIKGAQKSSNAIAEILLSRVRNTFEHVKPHHREGDNGASHISNYIGLCGKCNGERQRTGYDIFIKIHPEMIDNEQTQLDKIIDYINRGILIKYDNYPAQIKKALKTESNGALIPDIKKLDIKQAKKNRQLRQQQYIEKNKKESKKPSIFKFSKGILPKKTHQE